MPKPLEPLKFTVGAVLHQNAILMDYYKLCHHGKEASTLKDADVWLQTLLRHMDYSQYNRDDWNEFLEKRETKEQAEAAKVFRTKRQS